MAVIGAGAFGGWTALHLLRLGARVTLFDAWGPGNARASSGGATRIIRGTYGPDRVCTQLAARSLALWREHQQRWRRVLYRRIGVLWMAGGDGAYERAALPILKEAGLAFEELSPADAARRYPQMSFEGVRFAIYEHDAGYLTARAACAAVLEGFLAEGGEYKELAVEPGPTAGGEMGPLRLSDGIAYAAERYVFACGPWLGKLFPNVIGDLVRPTRQEVFFFGPPAGDARFSEDALPVWIDNAARVRYGIPGNRWRGFKVADDTRGPVFDPTLGERVATPEGLRASREYLGLRVPGLRDAPLLESRVCQYENSPDNHFILDRHPEAGNAWLVGGGSGHGFKHGPAVGELAADLVLGRRSPDPVFGLARFARPPDR